MLEELKKRVEATPTPAPVAEAPVKRRAHLPPPEPTDPLAPGPFAFADPERVRGILAGAGFTDIVLTPHDEAIGGNALDDALVVARKVGPAARLIADHPDRREAVLASMREVLAAHDTPTGVWFDSATWVVTARR